LSGVGLGPVRRHVMEEWPPDGESHRESMRIPGCCPVVRQIGADRIMLRPWAMHGVAACEETTVNADYCPGPIGARKSVVVEVSSPDIRGSAG
jgi:hypothetical protein